MYIHCMSVYVAVNECEEQLDNCDPLASCTDLPNGFLCVCPPGYTGDGTECDGRHTLFIYMLDTRSIPPVVHKIVFTEENYVFSEESGSGTVCATILQPQQLPPTALIIFTIYTIPGTAQSRHLPDTE